MGIQSENMHHTQIVECGNNHAHATESLTFHGKIGYSTRLPTYGSH